MKKLVLAVFLFSISLLYSQRQDTTLCYHYPVDSQLTLSLDMQHTDLTIKTAKSDSIVIITRVRVIPSNVNAPFAGISIHASQQSGRLVTSSIVVGEDIQPHNEFEAISEITIPEGTHLTINNRFGIVNLPAKTGRLIAHLDYVNLYADSLSHGYNHKIVANYSTLNWLSDIGEMTLNGTNVNLKARRIEKLTTQTSFSVFEFQKCRSLKTDSYTDRFVLSSLDSLRVQGEKTVLLLDTLCDFLQCELDYGMINIARVDSGFSQLNIANRHTKTHLGIAAESCFMLNADMRHCELYQKGMAIQAFESPAGKLYSGWYGEGDTITSALSLISAFGDVRIDFK